MNKIECGASCTDLDQDYNCGAYPSDPGRALRDAAVKSADEIGTLSGAEVSVGSTPSLGGTLSIRK